MMNGDPGIQMECTCGACPEQYEGTVDGNPAYFRLRHSHWTFTIVKPGASPYGRASQDEILYEESGDHNIGQDAGAMEDASSLIVALVAEFRRAGQGAPDILTALKDVTYSLERCMRSMDHPKDCDCSVCRDVKRGFAAIEKASVKSRS